MLKLSLNILTTAFTAYLKSTSELVIFILFILHRNDKKNVNVTEILHERA
jgi:hypothetical protein